MAAVGGPSEIDVEFDPAEAKRFGVDVCVGGDGRRTRIGYDVERGEVFVDRTRSGDVGLNRDFATVSRAKVPVRDGRVRMKVWVDASSVEVFADDGRVAVTQLVYPPEGARGVDVWSEGGEASVVRLEGWGMRSIWK
jgi:sucrose-6-phosphate hydrolase SacC (GH32 family)